MFVDRFRARLAKKLEGLAHHLRPKPTASCTGIAASWCPIHGDCVCTPECPTCMRSGREHIQDRGGFHYFCGNCEEEFEDDGGYDRDDPCCPLHGYDSNHAERAEDACRRQ